MEIYVLRNEGGRYHFGAIISCNQGEIIGLDSTFWKHNLRKLSLSRPWDYIQGERNQKYRIRDFRGKREGKAKNSGTGLDLQIWSREEYGNGKETGLNDWIDRFDWLNTRFATYDRISLGFPGIGNS